MQGLKSCKLLQQVHTVFQKNPFKTIFIKPAPSVGETKVFWWFLKTSKSCSRMYVYITAAKPEADLIRRQLWLISWEETWISVCVFNMNVIKLFLSVPFWEAEQACSPSRPINASALVCDFCTVLCMFAQDQDDSCGVYVRVEKKTPSKIRALSRTRLPATSSPGESFIQAEDESVSAVSPCDWLLGELTAVQVVWFLALRDIPPRITNGSLNIGLVAWLIIQWNYESFIHTSFQCEDDDTLNEFESWVFDKTLQVATLDFEKPSANKAGKNSLSINILLFPGDLCALILADDTQGVQNGCPHITGGLFLLPTRQCFVESDIKTINIPRD